MITITYKVVYKLKVEVVGSVATYTFIFNKIF